jgi:hypothetical protein
MSWARLLATLAATVSLTVAVAGTASAAVVTVGAQMNGGTWVSVGSGELVPGGAFDWFNPRSKAGANSPATGAIIGWNVWEAAGGPFYLRVLRPAGGGGYVGAGTSAGALPLTTGVEHFATDLPIQVGDTVGLDYTNATDKIGLGAFFGPNPPTFGYFASALPEGGTATPSEAGALSEIGFEVGFNAEVQPAPTVTAIGTSEGPAAGGGTVAITGTDLERIAAVHFGTAAATFSPISENSLTVTVPPGPPSTSVPISVTTVAGTATAPETFFYQPLPKGSGGSEPPITPEDPGTPEQPATPEKTGTPEQSGGTAGPGSSATGDSSAPGTSTPATNGTTPTPAATPAPRCTVPKLTATKLKAAKKKAAAADCKIGKVTKAKAGKTGKTGKVVAQSPKPGKVLAAGARVNVKIG